jgi:hypothetical protein
MNILVKLKESDDRVITLNVVTKTGECYIIAAEMLEHEFSADEVQICVHKPLHKQPNGCYAASSANRIIHNEEIVAKKDESGDTKTSGGVWFEFHDIDEIPEVKSDIAMVNEYLKDGKFDHIIGIGECDG